MLLKDHSCCLGDLIREGQRVMSGDQMKEIGSIGKKYCNLDSGSGDSRDLGAVGPKQCNSVTGWIIRWMIYRNKDSAHG